MSEDQTQKAIEASRKVLNLLKSELSLSNQYSARKLNKAIDEFVTAQNDTDEIVFCLARAYDVIYRNKNSIFISNSFLFEPSEASKKRALFNINSHNLQDFKPSDLYISSPNSAFKIKI